MTPIVSPRSTTFAANTGINSIDSLVYGVKWVAPTGQPLRLTYSFPEAGVTYATHYSGLNEPASGLAGLNAAQQDAVRGALHAWSDVANIKFTEITETAGHVGDIRIAWTGAAQMATETSPAWGWSYYPCDSPESGDIWLSSANEHVATDSWAPSSYNFEALIHELGHSLGLKHPFSGATTLPSLEDNGNHTVMSYTMPIDNIYPSIDGNYKWLSYHIMPETPMPFDIAAIQSLYGANMTFHTGDDTYKFDNTKPFYKTIWDAGGNDTIDVSNFSLGCTIDLSSGGLSDIQLDPALAPVVDTGGAPVTYTGHQNLGIAYGCTIENAIGGSGGDAFFGNDANNVITGNGGDDRITGGKGIDTAVFSGRINDYSIEKVTTNIVFPEPYSASNYVKTEYKVTDNAGSNGTDTLSGCEVMKFSDTSIILISSPGDCQIYRIYQTVFDRLPDSEGLEFWSGFLSHGNSLVDMSKLFLSSSEYLVGHGSESLPEQVNEFYLNTFHREPGQAGFDGLIAQQINDGILSMQSFVASISDSLESQSHLIGITGVHFVDSVNSF